MASFFSHNDSPDEKRGLLRRMLLNKYVVVLLVFLCIIFLSGEKSPISSFRRSRRISRTQEQIDRTRRQIDECNREIRTMGNTDSLERFAREHYYMHTDGEDVYLIGH